MPTTLEVEPALAVASPRWNPGDGVVCPFCGAVNAAKTGRCIQCSLEDTPATRAATRSRLGPWYVLRDPNVAARGMTFQTLTALVHRNVVVPESIVRGPATHQLWRWAGKVKGLSREMGFCYTCGESLGTTAEVCPHCNRSQTPPLDGDPLVETAPAPRPAARPAPTPQRSVAGQRYVPPQPDPLDTVLAAAAAAPATEPAHTEATEIEPPQPQRAPRRLPREDLLTPIDVAKAFSIQYDFTGNTPPAEPEQSPYTLAVATLTTAISEYARPLKLATAFLLLVGTGVAIHSKMTAHPARTRLATAWVERDQRPPAAEHTIETPPVPTETAVAAPARFVEPAAVPAAAPVPSVSAVAAEPVALIEPVPVSSPADDVSHLWAAALDAESRRDFASAVRSYERIRSLPNNTWPAGLAIRLKLARQELTAGTY